MPWFKTNRQTLVRMTQHRKLKNKQHEPHPKLRVISCALEGYADPGPHVAPVVLLIL